MIYVLAYMLFAAHGPLQTSTSTSRLFELLADPTRLRIIELLLDGERNVGELVAALGVQQGRVSSHLACLRWCGFIGTRREGKYVHYRITDERVRDLLHLAHRLLADHGSAIASCTCCRAETEGAYDDC